MFNLHRSCNNWLMHVPPMIKYCIYVIYTGAASEGKRGCTNVLQRGAHGLPAPFVRHRNDHPLITMQMAPHNINPGQFHEQCFALQLSSFGGLLHAPVGPIVTSVRNFY